MKKNFSKNPKIVRSGFSLIEVMLVLGISGLMLVGLLAGTFSSISSQRYTDAVRTFAEFLRSVYNEVISPESLGLGNSGQAILGKIIVFDPSINGDNGDRQAYTATIIGSADMNINPIQPSGSIMEELARAEATLYCGNNDTDSGSSTVNEFMSLWQTRFMQGKSGTLDMNPSNEFKGTFVIARSPVSNTVHTAFSKEIVYDLKNGCQPNDKTAEYSFKHDLEDSVERIKFSQDNAVNICIKSDDVRFVRAVRVAADGRNSSAISVINSDDLEDDEENPCAH